MSHHESTPVSSGANGSEKSARQPSFFTRVMRNAVNALTPQSGVAIKNPDAEMLEVLDDSSPDANVRQHRLPKYDMQKEAAADLVAVGKGIDPQNLVGLESTLLNAANAQFNGAYASKLALETAKKDSMEFKIAAKQRDIESIENEIKVHSLKKMTRPQLMLPSGLERWLLIMTVLALLVSAFSASFVLARFALPMLQSALAAGFCGFAWVLSSLALKYWASTLDPKYRRIVGWFFVGSIVAGFVTLACAICFYSFGGMFDNHVVVVSAARQARGLFTIGVLLLEFGISYWLAGLALSFLLVEPPSLAFNPDWEKLLGRRGQLLQELESLLIERSTHIGNIDALSNGRELHALKAKSIANLVHRVASANDAMISAQRANASGLNSNLDGLTS